MIRITLNQKQIEIIEKTILEGWETLNYELDDYQTLELVLDALEKANIVIDY